MVYLHYKIIVSKKYIRRILRIKATYPRFCYRLTISVPYPGNQEHHDVIQITSSGRRTNISCSQHFTYSASSLVFLLHLEDVTLLPFDPLVFCSTSSAAMNERPLLTDFNTINNNRKDIPVGIYYTGSIFLLSFPLGSIQRYQR